MCHVMEPNRLDERLLKQADPVSFLAAAAEEKPSFLR